MINLLVSATLAAATPVHATPAVAKLAGMHDMGMTHGKIHHTKLASHAKSGGMDCCKKGCCAHKGKHAAHKH